MNTQATFELVGGPNDGATVRAVGGSMPDVFYASTGEREPDGGWLWGYRRTKGGIHQHRYELRTDGKFHYKPGE